MKKKGFTLIEILAVVVILGFLILVATPMVGKVIRYARRKGYANSALGLIKEARVKVEDGDLGVEEDPEVTFSYPVQCIDLDKKYNLPFGRVIYANILIVYNEAEHDYDYYFDSNSDQKIGIKMTKEKDISSSKVVTNNTSSTTASQALVNGTTVRVNIDPTKCTLN